MYLLTHTVWVLFFLQIVLIALYVSKIITSTNHRNNVSNNGTAGLPMRSKSTEYFSNNVWKKASTYIFWLWTFSSLRAKNNPSPNSPKYPNVPHHQHHLRVSRVSWSPTASFLVGNLHVSMPFVSDILDYFLAFIFLHLKSMCEMSWDDWRVSCLTWVLWQGSSDVPFKNFILIFNMKCLLTFTWRFQHVPTPNSSNMAAGSVDPSFKCSTYPSSFSCTQ